MAVRKEDSKSKRMFVFTCTILLPLKKCLGIDLKNSIPMTYSTEIRTVSLICCCLGFEFSRVINNQSETLHGPV